VRVHDLRHGRASLLLAAGVDIAVVSKILGHGSISITSDTYAHLLQGVGEAAAEAACALLPRAPEGHPRSEPIKGPPGQRVGPPGLEPGTYGLKVRSSAIELEALLAGAHVSTHGSPAAHPG
jgi:Phage integrase family